jgi:hypothetical protein
MRLTTVTCVTLALLLSACTEDPPVEPPGTGGSTSTGGGGGAGGEGGTVVVGSTTLEGTVTDTDAAPIDQAQIGLCIDAECTTTTSDAMGAFAFADVPATAHRFEARSPAADSPPTIGAITVAVDLVADTPFTFSRDLVLPTTGLGKMLTSGSETLDVTDELEVTVDSDALTLPAGVTDRYLAGVRVGDQNFPPNVVPDTTVAMWVFNPYGATSSVEIKVAIDNVFSLPADQLVELHTVDHTTGLVVKVAEGQVSSDGLNITINGGIRRFTWLILALVT